ncbi:hypothetical protein HDZ31DRAFT_66028 [Schizophyllum fasciatum]
MLALEGLFAEKQDTLDTAVNSTQGQRWIVPRDDELVELASDAGNCESILRDAMRISEEEYIAFKSIVTHYAHILRAELCAEDQNAEDWDMVVKAISRDIPCVSKYEALWPIDAMLRRVINAVPSSEREPGRGNPPSMVGMIRRMLMPEDLSHCSQHPIVSYSEESTLCNEFLKKAGLTELTPFMVVAGIHDDAGFSMLCKHDEATRDAVIKTAKGNINLFQRLSLRYALGKVDRDGYV